MSNERLLLDTFFVIAFLNRNDQYHEKAKAFWPRVRAAREIWTTEAILVEIGNGLSDIYYRQQSHKFINQCYLIPNIHIVNVTTQLLKRALELYGNRQDKTWGVTDCISFTVMQDKNLTDALTADLDFEQAGFRALMRNTGS